MHEIRQTEVFSAWLRGLRDKRANKHIVERIYRLSQGNPGQHRSLKGGVTEMKIDIGPGYRVYFTRRGNTWIVLLCGGDKRTQQRDIRTAQRLAREI